MASRLRIGVAMAGYNVLGMRRPVTSQILVTKKCNMDCKMCFVYPLDKREKMKRAKEPTFEELEDLIDQSCRLGAQVIVPFGGEPLLRDDIGRIVKAIKDRRRFCMLYTNGTLVAEKIDELLDVDQLCISIDGDETTHDRIRGEGAYRRAIRALEVARAHGLVCRLHTALIPDTLHTLPHMSELSRKYDVMVNYGSCDATALTRSAEDQFVLTRSETISFLRDYLACKRAGVRISTPARVIRECARIMERWPIDGGTMSRDDARAHAHLRIPVCALRSYNIYIDCDGSAYPCLPLWGRETRPPNVYEMGLRAAWEHYAGLRCHQCASIFTIEKSLFYTFRLSTMLEYVAGYRFLASRDVPKG
jgi:MoaA/NifB/PqqE/SkfB family radical SAM enzyme